MERMEGQTEKNCRCVSDGELIEKNCQCGALCALRVKKATSFSGEGGVFILTEAVERMQLDVNLNKLV